MGCECKTLIFAVRCICGFEDRARTTQRPDRKYMMGSVAARGVKEGD